MNNGHNGDTPRENRRKNPRKPKYFIIATIIGIVMLVGASLGFLTASINTMPGLKNEMRPPASSQIFDAHGNLITTTRSIENRIPVPISKIPQNLQHAFIAAEDARFYQHIGVDPRGILRAVWANITNHGVSEGGSTITQQLAKNALLTQEQTLKRKIQEAVLALQIERQYSKSEILELYLNQIYFGQGAYGVQAAAQVYFGKNVEDLDLAECAMLAGIPKSPNYYSPTNNLKAAKERQNTVLEQLVKYEYIDNATAAKAHNEEIKIVSKKADTHEETAPYFVDYVIQQLIDKYGADAVYKDGLKIYTTLDLDMQKSAEKAMTKLPTYHTDSNGIKQPQGALVAIDPQTGYIKAMVGGRGNDQFNRAVLAERQPGSAFKPFVYLAAIESGLTPGTTIEDKPVTFGSWSPQNYDRTFSGKVSLRTALEQSLNVPTIKLANQIGVEKPIYYAQQMGITTLVTTGATNDRNLSMAIGGLTRGVKPLELASAYGVFANHGIHTEPIAITKIVDRNGKIIEENIPKEKVVVNEKSAYIITDMLRGVITRGTGTGANIGRPAAGKTGTTDDSKDAWFVGYTPDLVAAVWMGTDNDGTLSGVSGGGLPATIWRSFMTAALASYPSRDFVRPAGISDSQLSSDNSFKEDTGNTTQAKPNGNSTDQTTTDKAKNTGPSTPDKNIPTPNKPERATTPALPPPPTRPGDGKR
ncbi:penicillin-binding protein 1A [Sporomusaceae bacterium BoRhaA]|uniref:transglycosylase domain-containing protein n=1 Tax=Pelorhabdus rhamnosifermentans TaxID=2772457 RepID=UPI001C0647C7|nr:penicillin-binding protein 1A [Pelorhabdus rhamnosifermentans]MBU2701566.1 penicillin-binding protein 1A [Pelorhabdus rhamnosifermentans]